ncbi:MAG: hypothetical protein RLN69_11320, partial [Woeseiaceae bacterium]
MRENPILWQPDKERREATAMYRFMQQQSCDSYAALHQWSIANLEAFWQAHSAFCDVRFGRTATDIL